MFTKRKEPKSSKPIWRRKTRNVLHIETDGGAGNVREVNVTVSLFYYFILCLFKDSLNCSDYMPLNDWIVAEYPMNCDGYGKKRTGPD
jgi:hypothetical protein